LALIRKERYRTIQIIELLIYVGIVAFIICLLG
jgi:hypothetical protein